MFVLKQALSAKLSMNSNNKAIILSNPTIKIHKLIIEAVKGKQKGRAALSKAKRNNIGRDNITDEYIYNKNKNAQHILLADDVGTFPLVPTYLGRLVFV